MLTTDQPYVTELDLRHSLIPDELIDDLVKSMPEHNGVNVSDDDDEHEQEVGKQPKYDYIDFMSRFLDTPTANGHENS